MDGGAIARRPELSNGKNIVAIRIGSFDRSLEQVNGGCDCERIGMLEYWKTEAATDSQMLLEFDRLVPPSLYVQAPSWAWMIRWNKRGRIEALA